jgi:hypothetical protein
MLYFFEFSWHFSNDLVAVIFPSPCIFILFIPQGQQKKGTFWVPFFKTHHLAVLSELKLSLHLSSRALCSDFHNNALFEE